MNITFGMETKSKPRDPADEGIGPYKATKLWNDVITAFREGVPRGRHRRYMRAVEDCFVGSAAVDWLMGHLKKESSFRREVTRQQTTQLLNKFYKAGIFEEIQMSRRGRNKHDFSDTNRLYRLLPTSPSKGTRTPLAVRSLASSNIPATLPPLDPNKPSKRSKHKTGDKDKSTKGSESTAGKEDNKQELKSRSFSGKLRPGNFSGKFKSETSPRKLTVEKLPQCHLVGHILSFSEISEIWKMAALSRLKKVLGRSSLDDILQGYSVNGGNVRHNCIFLNKSGIVTNIPPDGHLPQWVLSAMKCLARWPEKVEGDLPSYPGFEKDVFGVVREYFLDLPEPLISHDLYDVITNVYVQACNQLPRHSSPYADNAGNSRSRLANSLLSGTSLENIILNLTRKYCVADSNTDLPSLTDTSRPDLSHAPNSRPERIRSACSRTDLARMTFSHSDLRGMTYSESDYFHSSKSHTDLYTTDYVHREQGHPNIFRMVESCGDLRLHAKHSISDLHVVPDRLGMSTISSYPSCMARSSGSGLSKRDGRKRFHSTPELQVAHYETAFGPENQTVTRVYYCNGVATDYQHGSSQESDVYSPVETHFDVAPDMSKHQRSSGQTSFERMRNKSGNLTSSYDHSKSMGDRSHSFNTLAHASSSAVNSSGGCMNDGAYRLTSNAPGVSNTSKDRAKASQHFSTFQQKKSLSPVWSTLPRSPPQRRSRAERYNTFGVAEFIFGTGTDERRLEEAGRQISSSTPYLPGVSDEDRSGGLHKGINGQSSSSWKNSSLFMNYPQSSLCEERATRALQVVLLFLAPASRRKLQFLLKLLSKMAANPFLILDPSQSTRSLMLSTFQQAVLQSGDELDEVLVLQLMSFLMDHHMDVLAVPTDMKDAVEERLKALEKPQIVYTPRDAETIRFCQPMSVQQYEATAQDHSQKALADLLDNIVKDQNMPDKDKCKRLKQFQKTYPEIYHKRFPSAEGDPLLAESRPAIKPPLLAKPLLKLRGLRV